jgi:hypothetical protein
MHSVDNKDSEGISSPSCPTPWTSPAPSAGVDASSGQEKANVITCDKALPPSNSDVLMNEKNFKIPVLDDGTTPAVVPAKTTGKSTESELVVNNSLCDDSTVQYMKMMQMVTEPEFEGFKSPRVSDTPRCVNITDTGVVGPYRRSWRWKVEFAGELD